MPEKNITITGGDVPKIERALIAWFKSQDLSSLDACFVMAHLIGVIFLHNRKEDVDTEEGLRALSTITANVAKGFPPMTSVVEHYTQENKRKITLEELRREVDELMKD